MDLIIESFRRLYQSGQINETTLLVMFKNGIITESDLDYIRKEER